MISENPFGEESLLYEELNAPAEWEQMQQEFDPGKATMAFDFPVEENKPPAKPAAQSNPKPPAKPAAQSNPKSPSQPQAKPTEQKPPSPQQFSDPWA
jgi:outer membrane biosynthesis protein TonB